MAGSQLTKRCPQCGVTKPHSLFFKSKSNPSGVSCWCRECGCRKAKEYRQQYPNRHKGYIRRWNAENREKINASRRKYRAENLEKSLANEREKRKRFKESNPHYTRDWRLRKVYGITLEQYNEILKKQKGRCAICKSKFAGSRFKNLLVDHCHSTGQIRGLLCNDCNLLIGHSEDNEKILKSALRYVRSWKQKKEDQ